MRSELLDEFLNIKNHIDNITPIVEDMEKLSAQDPDDFGLELCAMFNRATLEKKKEKCTRTYDELVEEVFEYRLTGDSIDYGSAPIELVGTFLTNLQKIFSRLAQEICQNVGQQIPANISKQTRLSVSAFAPGSFRIICNAPRPDAGVFNSSPEVFEDNLLTKSAEKLFDIFKDVNDEDSFNQDINDMSPYTVSALKDLLGVISKNGVNLDASWIKRNSTFKSELKNDIVSSRFSYLRKIETEPVKTEICVKGKLIELNRDRNTFLFEPEGERKIKVSFDEDAVAKMKKHGFNPLDYETVHIIELIKESYKTVSGQDKVTYTFLGFSSDES